MPSLILEGGTFRPVFSAGVMDALLDNDIIFPYCIGVSAGMVNCISYISKQRGRSLDILKTYRHDKRYLGLNNLLKCKCIFGLEFAFEEIPNKLNIFDMETYQNHPGKILVGVTNAQTGQPEYLDGKDLDDKCQILRATCSIPLFFPVMNINGKDYYDGGICDPIPIRKAISDGNEKHLIILTRPHGYIKELSTANKVVAKVLRNKYPNLEPVLLSRHNLYNETVQFCEQLEKEGKAIVFRPTKEKGIDSFEKDLDKIHIAYQHGYDMATENIDKIKSLFS